MTEEKLHELADRVEGLSVASREVDALITVALKIGCRPNLPDDLEHLSLPNKHDPGPGVTAGHYWFYCRSGMSLRSADFYTASIDAAMTLVPEGWHRHVTDGDNGDALCELWHDDTETSIQVRAKTWPTALCSAALRARAKGVSRG